MKGVIFEKNLYTYEGDIKNNIPHGIGIYYYNNGDRYVGDCRFGFPDGFGKYNYSNGSYYMGFFSSGKRHGIGTFENAKFIYKGSWRMNQRHGFMTQTNKEDNTTFEQQWIKGKLKEKKQIQYVQPSALQTQKQNPKYIHRKQKPITYDKLCIGCCDAPMNIAVKRCGHVSMCERCIEKCDRCPICRVKIDEKIKLFIS